MNVHQNHHAKMIRLSKRELIHNLHRDSTVHVPWDDIVDFSLGGLDREIIDDLYGGHLSTCDGCTAALQRAARDRPRDIENLAQVPEFATCELRTEEYTLKREARDHLRAFIESETGPLWIVAGEANPEVYDPTVGEALRERSKRARAIGQPAPGMICGPIIGLEDPTQDPRDTVIARLAAEGAIRLLVAEHRQKLHFRASDEHVYTENYHSAGSDGPRRGLWFESRAVARLMQRRFDALVRSRLAVSGGPERALFATMDVVKRVENAARAAGVDYDRMTRDRLWSAIESLDG